MAGLYAEFVNDAQQQCGQISRHLPRPFTARQQCFEEPGRSRDVAPFRDVHVNDLAVLIECPLHVAPHTGNLDVGLVHEPAITDAVATGPRRLDDQRREALHPPIDRDVVDIDPRPARSSATSRYDNPYRRYQRTANKITSGGPGTQRTTETHDSDDESPGHITNRTRSINATVPPIALCQRLGLVYVMCSAYRVPVARLTAAHAALQT
jgi:hypothetical protein